MKKLIALLWAAAMCFSLAACGSEAADNSSNEVPVVKEYQIGEAFGSDTVECIVTEIKWVTPDDFESVSKRTPSTMNGEHFYSINTELLFSDYTSIFGQFGCVESKIPESYFLCVDFSLQNTGKEVVASETEWRDSFSGIVVPYGTFEAIYDDGYTFNCGEDTGFTATLAVLGDAVHVVGGCNLPKQVFENEDKPLKLKVTLPNAAGEIEEFIVSVR